ncbi:MAG: hypothetical protein ACRDFS_01485, partial [Chloroflexota bacterium]
MLSLGGTIRRWSDIDRCTEQTVEPALPAASPNRTSIERLVDSGGVGGTAVEHMVVLGGGHTWPGGPRLPGLGRSASDVDAGEEIWRFASDHWIAAPQR